MDKQDMIVEFLHPHGPQKYFKCPINPDRCLVPVQSVLYTILVPVTTNWCMYKISDSEFDNIVKSMKLFLILCNLLLLEMLNLEIFIAESNKNFQLI